MTYTTYVDGVILTASELNSDNANSLDLTTTSPQTVNSAVSFVGLATGAMTVNGLLTLSGATVQQVSFVNAGASYSVLPTDRFVLIQKATPSAISVVLPSSPVVGRMVTVKDVNGVASTNTISIVPATGLIDGQSTYAITANFGVVTLIYNGSRWCSI